MGESYTSEAAVRRRQVKAIASKLWHDAVILGDWNNFGMQELIRLAEDNQLLDLWPQVNATDGFTFDTVANPMGAIHGKKGVRARCDAAMGFSLLDWHAESMRLLGTEPLKGLWTPTHSPLFGSVRHPLFPSDHF